MESTLRRKKRSSRKRPAATAFVKSVLVRAIRRASMCRVSVPPKRSKVRSSRTRRSFACMPGASAATSSRTMVPVCAISRRPGLRATAPVKAPRSWPKSSDSTNSDGRLAQSIFRRGASWRGLRWWIQRGSGSLPVPLSPAISTGVEAPAPFSARSRTRREAGSVAIQGMVAAALMDSYSRRKGICRTLLSGLRLLASRKKAKSRVEIGCATTSLKRSLLRGVAFGFVVAFIVGLGARWRRAPAGWFVELDALGVAPEALEVVILAGAFAENVHDEKSIIEQDPFGAGFAFAMRGPAPVAMQALRDGFADGLNLRLAGPGAEQEIIGERAGAGKVQDGNVQSLFFLSGFHGQQDFGIERVKGHR